MHCRQYGWAAPGGDIKEEVPEAWVLGAASWGGGTEPRQSVEVGQGLPGGKNGTCKGTEAQPSGLET